MNLPGGFVARCQAAVGRFMARRRVGLVRVLLIVFLLALIPSHLISADDDQRVAQERVVTQTLHWQLARWQDGVTVCNIFIPHELQPTPDEVTRACGRAILDSWLATPACAEAQNGGTGASCSGLLLRFVSKQTYIVTRQVELPRIRMWLEAVDCQPATDCANRPRLRVVAEEPLSDHKIMRVYVQVGDRERIYDGADGELRLPATGEEGAYLQFWAESDFGDTSERFEVKYRVFPLSADPVRYRFDVLSVTWKDSLPTGALLWNVFPPAAEPLPEIFEQPLSAGYLATTHRYALLAGNLIRAGKVDARACPDRGLTGIGAASPCGEMAAAQAVLDWQNQYDAQIFEAARQNDVPARLLKGMIAQESQFWPLSDNPYERGLGYVSQDGASLLLLWNTPYYLDICLPIYGKNTCASGYANLQEDRQTVLRGAAFAKIGTPEEIDMLGAMLFASAAQTGQLVRNVYRTDPSEVTTYTDLWKMSAANYYAGSGCMGTALRSAQQDQAELPITWQVLSGYLVGKCQIASDYVQRVMQYSQ